MTVKNMLCSKLHCQKGFNSILFSYKILVPQESSRITGVVPPQLLYGFTSHIRSNLLLGPYNRTMSGAM